MLSKCFYTYAQVKRACVSDNNDSDSRQPTFICSICLQLYVIAVVVLIFALAKHVFRSIRDCWTGRPGCLNVEETWLRRTVGETPILNGPAIVTLTHTHSRLRSRVLLVCVSLWRSLALVFQHHFEGVWRHCRKRIS